jgi:hypothetical protein
MENTLHKKAREGAKMKGVYTITRAFLETPAQFALDARICAERLLGNPVEDLVRQLNAMCRTEKMVIENIIPTVARTAIAAQLTDATPSPASILITHMALGTGVTAPANGDTQLQTEVYRNAIASLTQANNVAYMTGFFSSTETTGTYKEVALFMAGTLTVNTGTIFSRTAINITKTSVQTLTIDYTVTIS